MPKIISDDDTIDLDNIHRYAATADLFEALSTYGVPRNAWYVSGTTRHTYYGGRLVWERLAHRVPPMYGELHNGAPLDGEVYAA
jgi:hypothetical protein